MADQRLIAVSFAYPPEMSAMSILVWRLLRHCGRRFAVVCGTRGIETDPGLEQMAGDGADSLSPVPFREHPLHLLVRRVLHGSTLVRLFETPDIYRSWVPDAVAAAIALRPCKTDVIATFASPMSDHLAGLALKRAYPDTPWIAYFGDPWVTNPMIRRGPISRFTNGRMEGAVVRGADMIVFPCEEMAELTLRGYGSRERDKCRVVPHGYEDSLYPPDTVDRGSPPLIIRHIGSLYGSRTHSDLVEALRLLVGEEPGLAGRLRFEFFGYHQSCPDVSEFPPGLVTFHPAVDYLVSLRLMREAHGLLVITPSERESGAFLPSKLIDYIGARRPIIGVCRPGACTSLIERLGGWVSRTGEPAALAGNIRKLAAFLESEGDSHPWGDETVRPGYSAESTGRTFAGFIGELS